MSKRIPPEKRTQVIELHNQSLNAHQIAKRTGVAYTSVRNIISACSVNSHEPEAMPSCYKLVGSFDNAAHTALLCLNEGFDSDVTGILCRKYKIHIDDLKDMAEWARKNTVVIRNSSLQELETSVQNLQCSVDVLRSELNRANLLINEANAALAEYAKQQLIQEQKAHEYEALIQLQKKKLSTILKAPATFNVSPETRKTIVSLVAEAKTQYGLPVHKCLEALGLDRNDYYKWKKDPDCVDHRLPEFRAKQGKRKSEYKNIRALSDEEVQQVIQHLKEPRFAHLSIANMHRMLQAEGIHIASVSTYHRIAREYGFTRKKRRESTSSSSNNQRAKSDAIRMPLLATKPLEVLVWDITEVATGIGKAFMYACQDVYTKYLPLQRVYKTQDAENAVKFFKELFTTYDLPKDCQIWMHSDNGGPMISKITKAIFKEYNIMLSTSRALHSNDNAQIESYFKTFKKDMSVDLTDCYSFEAMNAKADMNRIRYNSIPHSSLNRVPPSIRFISPTLERMFLNQCKEAHLKHFEQHPERYIQKKMTSYEPAGPQFLNPSYEMLLQVLRHNPNDKKALKYIERMEQHHLLDGIDRTLEKQILAARDKQPDPYIDVQEL